MKVATIASLLCLSLPLALPAQRASTAPRAEGNSQVFAIAGSGAWVGVGVEEVTSENVARLKLKEERGVEIATVSPEGPAEKAGIKEHDVVLEFNGQRVDGVEQFRRLVRETPVGRNTKIVVSREGVPMTFNVKLGERPTPRARIFRSDGEGEGWVMPAMPPMPAMPATPSTPPSAPRARTLFRGEFPDLEWFSVAGAPRLGIEGDAIGKQLGEFFGVPGGAGVLVRSVTAGSPAEKAGIKAGDVIIKVENESVKDTGDLRSAVRERRDKSSFPVTIVRNKKEMTVTVKIEKTESRSHSPGDHV